MADYIDREKEIQSWQKAKEFDAYEHYSVDAIIDSLKNAPSVDAVEVVRCKDCKYRDILNNACLYPFIIDEEDNMYHKIVEDTDYCKWGEKNEV